MAFDAINDIVVASKCDLEAAEDAINQRVASEVTFDGGFARHTPPERSDGEGIYVEPFPKRDMKVYRLDAENSPKK